MHWIPVTNASGHTCMEAVWVTETAPASAPVSVAQTAAAAA